MHERIHKDHEPSIQFVGLPVNSSINFIKFDEIQSEAAAGLIKGEMMNTVNDLAQQVGEDFDCSLTEQHVNPSV